VGGAPPLALANSIIVLTHSIIVLTDSIVVLTNSIIMLTNNIIVLTNSIVVLTNSILAGQHTASVAGAPPPLALAPLCLRDPLKLTRLGL